MSVPLAASTSKIMYVTGMRGGELSGPARSRTCIRSARAMNDGRPSASSSDDLAVEHRVGDAGRGQRRGQAGQLRVGGGDLGAGAGVQAQRARRASTASARTPSHLNSYAQPGADRQRRRRWRASVGARRAPIQPIQRLIDMLARRWDAGHRT